MANQFARLVVAQKPSQAIARQMRAGGPRFLWALLIYCDDRLLGPHFSGSLFAEDARFRARDLTAIQLQHHPLGQFRRRRINGARP